MSFETVPGIKPPQGRWEPMERPRLNAEVNLPTYSSEMPEFPPLLPVITPWSPVDKPELDSSLEWLRETEPI